MSSSTSGSHESPTSDTESIFFDAAEQFSMEENLHLHAALPMQQSPGSSYPENGRTSQNQGTGTSLLRIVSSNPNTFDPSSISQKAGEASTGAQQDQKIAPTKSRLFPSAETKPFPQSGNAQATASDKFQPRNTADKPLDESDRELPLSAKSPCDRISWGTEIARECAEFLHNSFDQSCQNRLDGISVRDLPKNIELSSRAAEARYKCLPLTSTAFLGKSGCGKSSLISSIIGIPGISPINDMGSNYTLIPLEYSSHSPEFSSIFPVVVSASRLQHSEVQLYLQGLLEKWHSWSPSLESTSNTSKAAEAEEAWFILKTLFSDESGFFDLQPDQVDPKGSMLEKLTNRAMEIPWPYHKKRCMLFERSFSASFLVGLWTHEEASQTISLLNEWKAARLIEKISISLGQSNLKKDHRIIDVPDWPSSQIKNMYPFGWDHAFFVTDINRALSDNEMKQSLIDITAKRMRGLYRYGKGISPNLSSSIVCTRSEDVNARQASKNLIESEERLAQSLKSLGLEKDGKLQDAPEPDQEAQESVLKKRNKISFMRARNQHIESQLKQSYAKYFDGKEPNVFCVSNKMFEKYSPTEILEKAGKSDTTALVPYEKTVEENNTIAHDMIMASGIPALREFCITFKERKINNFIQNEIGELLSLMKPYVSQRCTLMPPEASHIRQYKHDTLQCIGHAMTKWNTDFSEVILSYSDKRTEAWQETAKSALQTWRKKMIDDKKFWSSFPETDNIGIFQARHNQYRKWNEALVWNMRAEIEIQWCVLLAHIPEIFKEVENQIEGHLLRLEAYIKDIPEGAATVSGYRKNSHDKWREWEADLRHGARSALKRTIYTGEDTVIMQEMTPIYQSLASIEEMQKSPDEEWAKLEHMIKNGDLFAKIIQRSSQYVNRAAKPIFAEISHMVEELFSDVKSAFDGVSGNAGKQAQAAEREDRHCKDFQSKLMKWQKEYDEFLKHLPVE